MKINKKRLIIICTLVVIGCMLVAAAVYAGVKINGYFKGVNYLSVGEYRKAVFEFSKVSSIGLLRAKYEKDVKDAANNLYEKLAAGEMSYEEVTKNIKILGKLVKMDDIQKRLELLDESISNYNKGEEFKADGEYVHAIESYSLVKKGDEYYDKAQNRISECIELLETKTVTTLEQYRRNKNFAKALLLIKEVDPYLKKGTLDKYKKIFETQKLEVEQKEEIKEKMRAYEGKWVSSAEESKTGIIEVTIHSIGAELASFSMSYSEKSGTGRIASAKYITGTVSGNNVSAVYKDNFGNQGRITLTLKENSIIVSAKESYSSNKGFGLACRGTLYK